MIQNIKIIFRHLSRQKLNTSLHIIGLTLGLSVCLIIALFIRYELSFDTYHENASRTYRVISKWTEGNGEVNTHFSTPFPLANAIRTEMSGVERVSFAHPPYVKIVEISAEKKFMAERILAVEADYPEILNIETLKGDLHKTLQAPYQAAITESTAKKFFGSEDPIGKTLSLKMDGNFEFTIGALI
jgi:putative ABC transport system permease protein